MTRTADDFQLKISHLIPRGGRAEHTQRLRGAGTASGFVRDDVRKHHDSTLAKSPCGALPFFTKFENVASRPSARQPLFSSRSHARGSQIYIIPFEENSLNRHSSRISFISLEGISLNQNTGIRAGAARVLTDEEPSLPRPH